MQKMPVDCFRNLTSFNPDVQDFHPCVRQTDTAAQIALSPEKLEDSALRGGAGTGNAVELWQRKVRIWACGRRGSLSVVHKQGVMIMMNAFKLVFSAAAVAVALSAGGAGAVTVSLIDHSTNGVGNQAHVFGAQFNGTTPVGSSWDAGGTPLVTPPPAVVGNAYESPFRNTPIAGSVNPRPAGTPGQSFFVSGSERATDTTLDSPKTLTFNNLQTTFTILWGSIDTYNTIAFLDSIGNTVASYTGSQIISALGLSLTPNSAGNYNEVALMTFGFGDSEAFKSVRFTSQFQGADKSAFEFALSSVPLPAGGVLMLTAFAGLAALRRRRAAA